MVENLALKTVVGEFIATDPKREVLTYQLVSGQGDESNSLFLMDTNGTLKTDSSFDYETNASNYSIRVQVKDDENATVEGIFTVTLTDDVSDNIEASYKVSGGQGSFPYYTFEDADGNVPDFTTFPLIKGKNYEFVAAGVSGSHPFMIGESYGDTSSVHLTGGPLTTSNDGSKIILSVPLDYSGNFSYYCQNHSEMVQQFQISPNRLVDLNTSVMLEMLWVEPGTFTMGSPTTETGRGTNETEHNVSLTKGFYLGKYEVTQAQYEAVMTGFSWKERLLENLTLGKKAWVNTNGYTATPSEWPNNPNRPVENVSCGDIQIFLTRLNAQQSANIPAGWVYVLPTESQWEYACRAGTTTAYSWGNVINATRANYKEFEQKTRDVGYYAANPWGFFDMHGNVWEWTADWYGTYPVGNPVIDPTGAASGSWRVKRGGSWGYDGTSLRSAKRSYGTPSTRTNNIGFRVGFQKQ
jgi:formylglycine-generating enzyme required for sulfatase activity